MHPYMWLGYWHQNTLLYTLILPTSSQKSILNRFLSRKLKRAGTSSLFSDLPASVPEHGSKIMATTKHLHSPDWLTVHLDAGVDARQRGLRLFLPIICKFKLKLLMSDCLRRPIYVTRQARAPSLWTPRETIKVFFWFSDIFQNDKRQIFRQSRLSSSFLFIIHIVKCNL